MMDLAIKFGNRQIGAIFDCFYQNGGMIEIMGQEAYFDDNIDLFLQEGEFVLPPSRFSLSWHLPDKILIFTNCLLKYSKSHSISNDILILDSVHFRSDGMLVEHNEKRRD